MPFLRFLWFRYCDIETCDVSTRLCFWFLSRNVYTSCFEPLTVTIYERIDFFEILYSFRFHCFIGAFSDMLWMATVFAVHDCFFFYTSNSVYKHVLRLVTNWRKKDGVDRLLLSTSCIWSNVTNATWSLNREKQKRNTFQKSIEFRSICRFCLLFFVKPLWSFLVALFLNVCDLFVRCVDVRYWYWKVLDCWCCCSVCCRLCDALLR